MSCSMVILDGKLANPGDLSWSSLERYGELKVYDYTPDDQIIARSSDAEVILLNKVKLNKYHLSQLPRLKLVSLLATGYDNVDIVAAREKGIAVCNAVGYGSDSVAQHVFALILRCTNMIEAHNQSVHEGLWFRESWSYTLSPIKGLRGKTLGIIGLGDIGTRVADLASSFGMKVKAFTRSPSKYDIGDIQFVSLNELLTLSDIISLHLPLNHESELMINQASLSLMKKDAIIVNTSRGGLVDEFALREHLLANPGFTAALDVLSKEPPDVDHPLIGLTNCILTPHSAWSNADARSRLIEISENNIRAYLEGNPINVVN